MKSKTGPKKQDIKPAINHNKPNELKTEEPISEKDEVKQAEERTNKTAKK